MMWNLQLSNNSFEWKNVTFIGGRSKHTLAPPTYFHGIRTPNPPWSTPPYDCQTVKLLSCITAGTFRNAEPKYVCTLHGQTLSSVLTSQTQPHTFNRLHIPKQFFWPHNHAFCITFWLKLHRFWKLRLQSQQGSSYTSNTLINTHTQSVFWT